MHLYAYVLPVSSYTLSSRMFYAYSCLRFGNRSSDKDDTSFPEEGEVRPLCATQSYYSLHNGNLR